MLGFWTAAFWYSQPCARSPELLGRLFFTIATLFDGKPGEMVADGRPQPLVHGHKNLPDAVGVSINSLLIATTVAGLLGGRPQWCWSSAGLEGYWALATVGFTALIQVRSLHRLRSTRDQTSTAWPGQQPPCM